MNQSARALKTSTHEDLIKSADQERRLRAYTLSAAAAGVAVMACSVAADAAPVCKSSLDIILKQSIPFNPAGQEISPFELADTYNNVCSMTGCFWNRGFLTPNLPLAGVQLAASGLPANLATGARIGPGGRFGEGTQYGLLFTYGPVGGGTKSHHNGNLDFSKENYFGFRFPISGQSHYGWVRMSVTFNRYNTVTDISLLEYAYESNPNTAILAGSCSAPAPPIAGASTPSTGTAVGEMATNNAPTASLGVLALGAPGLTLWRRK